MKVLFIVQGEGRGHLTQAVSMWQLLTDSGHQVQACLVGKSTYQHQSFLESQLDAPVDYFVSPNLAYGVNKPGLSLRRTLSENLRKIPQLHQSIIFLRKKIKYYQPDLIINFYDLLGGITKALSPDIKIPMVCIAHQYLLLHKDFDFPVSNEMDKFLVNLNTRITALRANKLLALSFAPLNATKKIISVPPLLRKEIEKEQVGNYNYLLAYMTNECFLSELIKWSEKNPQEEIHCFVQRSQENEVEQISMNLFIHKPHAHKFLHLMANCKGLITSAGFESVSEAIYLGKPIMMIPVPRHFEQKCNAHDASTYGAGIAAEEFNPKYLLDFIHQYESPALNFRNWLVEGKQVLLRELEKMAKPSFKAA